MLPPRLRLFLVLMAEDVLPAVAVLPVAFGFILEAAASITGIAIILSKKTYLVSIAYAVQVVVFGVASYILGPIFGITGIAYAFLFSKIIFLMLQDKKARENGPL